VEDLCSEKGEKGCIATLWTSLSHGNPWKKWHKNEAMSETPEKKMLRATIFLGTSVPLEKEGLTTSQKKRELLREEPKVGYAEGEG